MMHQEEYKGHQITVDTLQRGKSWTATYQIDGGEIRQLGDRPLRHETIILSEAIDKAKRVIDHMKP
jgi:hypothetical protein